MPQDNLNLIQRLAEHGWGTYVLAIVLSMLVSAMKLLTSAVKGEKVTWIHVLLEIITGSVLAVVTMMLCQYKEVDVLLSAVAVFIVSHTGVKIIPLIADKTLKGFIDVTQNTNK